MYKKVYYIVVTGLCLCLLADCYSSFNKRFYHSFMVKVLFILTVALAAFYLLRIIYKNQKRIRRHEQIDKLLDKN